MCKLIRSPFTFIQLWLGVTGSLLAQGAAPELRAIQHVSFYMYGGQELLGEFSQPDKSGDFLFKSVAGPQNISLLPGKKTLVFARAPEPKVVIWKESPGSLPGKPSILVPLAEAVVSPAWRSILVLIKMDESTGHMSLTPIDKNMPTGSVVFVNLANFPLIIDMGGGHVKVDAFKQAILSIGLTGDTAAMVRILISSESAGQRKVVSSGSYAFSSQDRRIVLLEPGKTGRIRMSLLDVPPADLSKPAHDSDNK